MTGSITLRTTEEARSSLSESLETIDVEIEKEVGEGDFWELWVTFGNFPLLIQHPENAHYCVLSFQITLPDERTIARLNDFYARYDAKFQFRLTRAFSSPLTGFSRIADEGRVIGYTVSKFVYPYHPEFSVLNLDAALQAVVSVGAIGAAFLRAELGQHSVSHRTSDTSTPGPMFS